MLFSRRALPVLCLLAAKVASAAPTIDFKSREIQTGRKYPQTLLTAPGVSESSGQLTYSYPIDIPAGRGVTPSISLDYSSSAPLSEFGYGWDLTIPMIERTQRHGAPRVAADGTYSEELYRFKNGLSSSELVPTGEGIGSPGIVYRERTERTFNRYIQYADKWVIETPGGVRYELGGIPGSRRGTNILSNSGTAAWLVDRIIDTNNNYATYEYAPDLGGNAQIHWIRYNGNTGTALAPGMAVEFVWQTHLGADGAVRSYRGGYRRLLGDRRLASIASAITSKPATCDRLKTGHFGRSGTVVDYFESESLGKLAA